MSLAYPIPTSERWVRSMSCLSACPMQEEYLAFANTHRIRWKLPTS